MAANVIGSDHEKMWIEQVFLKTPIALPDAIQCPCTQRPESPDARSEP